MERNEANRFPEEGKEAAAGTTVSGQRGRTDSSGRTRIQCWSGGRNPSSVSYHSVRVQLGGSCNRVESGIPQAASCCCSRANSHARPHAPVVAVVIVQCKACQLLMRQLQLHTYWRLRKVSRQRSSMNPTARFQANSMIDDIIGWNEFNGGPFREKRMEFNGKKRIGFNTIVSITSGQEIQPTAALATCRQQLPMQSFPTYSK